MLQSLRVEDRPLTGTQFGEDRDVETWPTDTVDDCIGRAPGIQSLLHWAGPGDLREDQQPITKPDVGTQQTVNGVHFDVVDGHLWAFLDLHLTGQVADVSNTVPSMRGLEVWRRIIGELFALTDPRCMDHQTLVHDHDPTGPPRIREAQAACFTHGSHADGVPPIPQASQPSGRAAPRGQLRRAAG